MAARKSSGSERSDGTPTVALASTKTIRAKTVNNTTTATTHGLRVRTPAVSALPEPAGGQSRSAASVSVPPSVKIRHPMRKQWSERVPPLRGELTTLREIAVSDVYTLFTLFADPAGTD